MKERIAARLWRFFGPPGSWDAARDSEIKRGFLKAADSVLAEIKPLIREEALDDAMEAVHKLPGDSEVLRAIRTLKSKGQKP